MNKTFKKILSITFAIIFIFGSIPMANLGIENLFAVKVEAITGVDIIPAEPGEIVTLNKDHKVFDDFVYVEWDYDEDGIIESVEILKYMGNKETVLVPETIKELPVVSLGQYSFSPLYIEDDYYNPEAVNISKIVLPDTIQSIDWYAFSNCSNLEEINMPTGLCTLAGYVFKYTKVKIIDIKCNTDLQIYEEAFTDSRVEELTIEADWLELVGLTNRTIKKLTVNAEKTDVSIWGATALETVIFESPVESFSLNTSSPQTIVFKSTFPGKLYETLMITKSYHYITDANTGAVTFYLPEENSFIYDEATSFSYYINNQGKAIITEYKGDENNVVIPETLGGAEVIEISSFAFKKVAVKSVSIPDTVEKINAFAFYECYAQNIYLGKNLKVIGHSAFKGCNKITDILFPESLEVIEGYAFYDCNALKTVELPEKIKKIDDYTFFNCGLLYSVVGENVEEIGKNAFSNSYSYSFGSLVNVNFSEKLNTVGKGAFYDNQALTSIGVSGESIKSIGSMAFGETAIDSFVFSDELKEIPDSAFENCKNLTNIEFPEGLEYIGDKAFYGCKRLTIGELPKSIVSIGESAFRLCSSVGKTIVIPENVIEIGEYAFYDTAISELYFNAINCSAAENSFFWGDITSVVFGDKVTYIPDKLFYGNCYIKKVVLPQSVTGIGQSAFEGISSLEEVNIPDGVTYIGQSAFRYCRNLKEFTIPKGIKTFDESVLWGCNKIETIYFNAENCTFVGLDDLVINKKIIGKKSPFENLYNLKNIVLGDTVKVIPAYMYSGLIKFVDRFRNIVLPDSVTDIGEEAFAHNTVDEELEVGVVLTITLSKNLEAIERKAFYNTDVAIVGNAFPEKLMMIGESAFEKSSSITEFYIPDSVIDVAENAFANCKNLTKVRMSSNVRLISENTFANCKKLSEFIWETNYKIIGKNAFQNCVNLKDFDFAGVEKMYESSFTGSGVNIVMLGENKKEEATELEVVEVSSFENCANLETLSIGGNVTTIKSEAFANCGKLETAVISPTVTNIAADAFDGCDALTIYCVEDSYVHEYAVNNGISVSTFVIDAIPNQVYTGKEIEPDVNVKVSNKTLTENTDFAVKYSDNINVGTAKVLVSGKGIYKVLASVANFTIITKDLENIIVSPVVNQVYTGSEIRPELTITNGDEILTEGVDYTVTYKNNTEAGTATAEITGIGNYSGKTTVTFEIEEQTFWQKVVSFFRMIFNAIRDFFNSIFK